MTTIALISLALLPLYFLYRNEVVYVHQKLCSDIIYTYNMMLVNKVYEDNIEKLNNGEDYDSEYKYYHDHKIEIEDMTDGYGKMVSMFWRDTQKFLHEPKNADMELFKKAVRIVCAKE